jgi:hypothetical protein
MSGQGLELTLAALRNHLESVAWRCYELRLIDARRRRCVATRHWTAAQLTASDTVRFLRAWNRDGCDVYFRPYAGSENAGYVLVDFDGGPCPLAEMQAAGHAPCLVVQTSPGHQQAWVRVGLQVVQRGWATAAARYLALRYGGDPASAEWRHLGRLAGFTNRKPARAQPNGLPPWVRIVCRRAGAMAPLDGVILNPPQGPEPVWHAGVATVAPSASSPLYQQCLDDLRLRQRFPALDWSIADYRVARLLLRHRWAADRVAELLRQGSPGFPRRHSQPDDYLRRTIRAAAASLDPVFFRAPIPLGRE